MKGKDAGAVNTKRKVFESTYAYGLVILEALIGLSLGSISIRVGSSNIPEMGFTPRGLAQVVPDATLGSESSQLTPNVMVNGALADQINGGAIRGANLFHSFQQFSIGNDQRVYFANPAGIDHILTRVTGLEPSNIFGTLGVDGGASLFLINPNGVVFGANARLEIAGSLVASTTSGIRFADGSEFSATNPQALPLLTVSLPIGPQLGTGELQPALAPVINSGNLIVGQNLSLVGSAVTSSGILNAPQGDIAVVATTGNTEVRALNAKTATLSARNDLVLAESQLYTRGNLTLTAQGTLRLNDSQTGAATLAAGGDLLVQGNQGIDLFALSHANSGLWSGGNLTLRSEGTIIGDAHYQAGGNFRVESLDGNLRGFISPNDPVIRADGDVSFGDYTGASLHIFAGGSVFAVGTITITGPDAVNGITETVTLSNGQSLAVDGAAFATLDIRAGTTAFNCTPATCGTTGAPAPDFLTLFPSFFPSADIFIGSVVIANDVTTTDGLVYLTNRYNPNAAPTGTIQVGGIDARSFFGNSSAVVIDSRSDIGLSGATFPDGTTFAIAGQTFGGNGSNITLLATGDIVNNSVILSDGFLGGRILLNTSGGTVLLNNDSTISSVSQFGFPGDTSGGITIVANSLQMQPGSSLFTQNLGPDETGGSITINVSGAVSLLGGNTSLFSQVGSDTFTFPTGTGGAIAVDAQSLSLTNGAQLFTRTFGAGKAGDITLTIDNGITVDGSFLFSDVQANADGAGGSLTLTSGDLMVTNAGQLFTRTIGKGKAGDLTATASNLSFLNASNIFSQIEVGAIGAGGTVNLTSSGNLTITNGTRLFTRTRTAANAGDIKLDIAGNMTLTDVGFVFSEVTAGATGTGGNLDISVGGSLAALNAGGLSTQTQGAGNAGNLRLVVAGNTTLDQLGVIFSIVDDGATGKGGAIDISTAGSFSATNGGSIATSTQGGGNAGNVVVRAIQGITLNQGTVSSTTTQPSTSTLVGKGGALTLSTDGAMTLNNGSRISTLTRTSQLAGAVTLQSGGAIELDSSIIQSNSEAGATGSGGDLSITAPSLAVRNGGSVQSLTGSAGNSGKVTITVAGGVVLDGINAAGEISSLVSNVTAGATGNGNDVTIAARSLTLTNGAQVGTATFGQGRSGNVLFNISDTVSLSGEAANGSPSIISAQSRAGGDAGSVTVQTRQLTLLQGGQINSTAFDRGAGGKLAITASDAITLNGTSSAGTRSGLFASSQGTVANAGSGGSVEVTTPRLTIGNGAQISASTSGSGRAGDIVINSRDILTLDGSGTGIFASTAQGSSGQGGSIRIDPIQVSITNNARISVSSLGSGNGGNVFLQAGKLTLDRGFITAETASGEGGNITMRVGDVFLLRNGSLVSATAGGTGNGGNLDIGARFIIAPTTENSDIIANAFQGRGGNVLITTDGIFGLEFRPRLTPLNDITASSEFGLQGVVTIVTPNVDPSKGVVSLPGTVVDASQQIAQGCRPAGEAGRFVATGRGGLPPVPGETIGGDALWEDIRVQGVVAQQGNGSEALTSDSQPSSTPTPAQGWVMDDRGNVTLVAQMPKTACY